MKSYTYRHWFAQPSHGSEVDRRVEGLRKRRLSLLIVPMVRYGEHPPKSVKTGALCQIESIADRSVWSQMEPVSRRERRQRAVV